MNENYKERKKERKSQDKYFSERKMRNEMLKKHEN